MLCSADDRRRAAQGNPCPAHAFLTRRWALRLPGCSIEPRPTLSGGEASSGIRLASQVGAGLVGVLYILDEPSIGFRHPRDNDRFLTTCAGSPSWVTRWSSSSTTKTRVRAADHLVDFGPGPGVKGGEVVALGRPSTRPEAGKSPQSLTGRSAARRARRRFRSRDRARSLTVDFSTIKGATSKLTSRTIGRRRSR